MKVLVATSEGQGGADGDYCWTLEGELVYVQAFVCSNPECGCDRGFAGLASSRSTTTAKIVDRPDITFDRYLQALADSLARDGWIDDEDEPGDGFALVWEALSTLMTITRCGAEGDLVRRRRDKVLFDGPAEAA